MMAVHNENGPGFVGFAREPKSCYDSDLSDAVQVRIVEVATVGSARHNWFSTVAGRLNCRLERDRTHVPGEDGKPIPKRNRKNRSGRVRSDAAAAGGRVGRFRRAEF
jgi:hypothetical protein